MTGTGHHRIIPRSAQSGALAADVPMAHIELRHLRTLVALRDTGSLVEAAERVCLTQSALSHQIKELEKS